MIRMLYRNRAGRLRSDLTPEEFPRVLRVANSLLWVDFEGEPDATAEPILREVLNKLARDAYPVIDAKDRIFFRDVYDHLVRLHDINESMCDLVAGSLDMYLSGVSNGMNEVMRTLTVFTTLFMPISFIAGFFGMNFFQGVPPHEVWTSNVMFVLTILLMVAAPLTMYLWIKQRRWM